MDLPVSRDCRAGSTERSPCLWKGPSSRKWQSLRSTPSDCGPIRPSDPLTCSPPCLVEVASSPCETASPRGPSLGGCSTTGMSVPEYPPRVKYRGAGELPPTAPPNSSIGLSATVVGPGDYCRRPFGRPGNLRCLWSDAGTAERGSCRSAWLSSLFPRETGQVLIGPPRSPVKDHPGPAVKTPQADIPFCSRCLSGGGRGVAGESCQVGW